MLTFEQIKELVELVARHRLRELELERAGFRLRLSAGPDATAREPVAAPWPSGAAVEPVSPLSMVTNERTEAASVASSVPPAAVELHVVTSPIVGTFFTAPSPESPPYARVGDRVRKGQVLCIVEAMKLMNEIECDIDGVVAEIYPKNAQPIEYGEPLFGLHPD